MPDNSPSFRDFGILPEGLSPPAGNIRSYFSTGRVIGQYIGTAIVLSLGLGLTVLMVFMLPWWLSLPGSLAALSTFGIFAYLATRDDYRWAELQGNTLRAKHLYTGRTIERSVDEIESLATIVNLAQNATTTLVESLLGRIRAIEIRFRDRRTPLRISRSDPAMTNAKELIEGVLYRLTQIGELEADVADFRGTPIVRNIHWKGEQPFIPSGNIRIVKAVLCFMMCLALLFGMGLSFEGQKAQHQFEIGSVAPQEITLRSLIKNGPGANRHVTVTDFVPLGYVFETASRSSSGVMVPLVPQDATPNDPAEIKAILTSKNIHSEPALIQLLQPGRVTGICSEAPRSRWGDQMQSELEQVSEGRKLLSAWEIEEMQDPPTAATVRQTLMESIACYVATMVLAAIIYWKSR